jgi:hypothetical protein
VKTFFNSYLPVAMWLCGLVLPVAAQVRNRAPLARGHVLTVLPAAARLARTPQSAATPITVTAMLDFSDRAGFEKYVSEFEDPASANYHVTLTENEFAARFGPTGQAYNTVQAFLQQSGLTIINGSANRLTITAQGSRSQVEQAFAVAIDDYQLGGRRFHANDTEPSLPSAIAPLVRSLAGLNDLSIPEPSLSPAPALPQSIGTAYGAGLMPPGINGAGQTIALIEFDNFNRQDVVNWLQAAKLPPGLINQVSIFNVNGGTGPSNTKGTTEVLLDIDTVLGIAPGAKIVVVSAPKNTAAIDVINSAFNAIRGAPGQSQGIISDSWSSCEREISNSDLDSMETLLQAIAVQGGSFFAASGDNGSTCINGGIVYPNRVGVPSAAPHAVSVGGTTLSVTAGNTYQNESWWTNGAGAGGYGVSWHFGRPAYQAPYNSGSLRSVPDIAADADPNTAILVCQGGSPAAPNCGVSTGGTSMAAPIWASVWALSCQAKGVFPCGASPELLYSLKPDAFRGAPVMTGPGNDFAHVGLGSPNIPVFAARVAGTPQIQSLNPSAGPLTGGTSVVINGQFFIGVTGVKFGQTPALSFTVNSISQITAVAPPFADPNSSGSQHAVTVSVTTALGEFSSGVSTIFRYNPGVTGVSPNYGPITGGGAITITGSGFVATRGTEVYFGSQRSPNVYCYNSTSCVAELPPSPVYGTFDVIVAAGGGTSVPAKGDQFTYLGPTITRISPQIGPETGGTQVYLYGVALTDTLTFKFGNTVVKAGCFTATWCEVFSPPGAGVVNVSLIYNGVQSAPSPDTQFTYAKYPAVAGVVPNTGPGTGGSVVTIVGSNFSTSPGAVVVKFGAAQASNVHCTATQCTATTPPGTSLVDVIVSVNGLPSPKSASDQFGYLPVITGVAPASGPRTGGTSVTITGAGLSSAATGTVLTFGANAAAGTCSATSCTAQSPAGTGIVDIQAVVDGHSSTKTAADRFTYTGAGLTKGWTQWQLPLSNSGNAMMTHDTVRHQLLYIDPQWDDSGNSLNDLTYTWDSVTAALTRQTSAAGPSVTQAAVAFDDNRGKAVLFGGVWFTRRPTGIGTIPHLSSATWIWDGSAWSVAAPAAHPPARVFATMTDDAAHSRIVLFGGCTDTRCTTVLGDTWTWDGVNWKQEAPPVSPPARNQAAMTYDPGLAKVVLFGGRSNGEMVTGGLGDMWTWDGQSWAQLHPPALPPARYAAGLAYSRADSGLVMFGGTGTSGYLPETWIWNGLTWIQAVTTPAPPIAFFVNGMAYDSSLDAAALMLEGQLWTWGGRP